MRVVINTCFGGFRLSEEAYEKLIEYGVPLRDYVEEKRDPVTHLFVPDPSNDGEVILRGGSVFSKYWDTWTRDNRTHPLVVQVVEELGERANGPCARLKIVVIPENVDWDINAYDGREHVAEKHRCWS